MKRIAATVLASVALTGCARKVDDTDAAIFKAGVAGTQLCAAFGTCNADAETSLDETLDFARKHPCDTIGKTTIRTRVERMAGKIETNWPAGARRIDRALRGMPKC